MGAGLGGVLSTKRLVERRAQAQKGFDLIWRRVQSGFSDSDDHDLCFVLDVAHADASPVLSRTQRTNQQELQAKRRYTEYIISRE